ncbi:MAG: CDP-glucose 4,6-dehydratase [Candidatus Eremiobacteraeota bacterium]|nr:CDP-glucose 4,6-dehydratase [Candidatus Eremiobacteraeota bacterium]
MNRAFWNGRRVFVSGHTGFKGSWLCVWLQQMGATVTGFGLAPHTRPSLFIHAKVAEGMMSLTGDVTNLAAVAKALRSSKSEIVIHLAAQALVRRSYAAPAETYATNVLGTIGVLQAARACSSVRAVVNVTSDKCYDLRAPAKRLRESDAIGGIDPYSNSKAWSEIVTAAYRAFSDGDRLPPRASSIAFASARAGNVIGGGDWSADRLIPDLISAYQRRRRAAVRLPRAVRPWQHVLDPLSGYLSLAQRLCESGSAYAEAWNFGPPSSHERSVRWMADRCAMLWGSGASWKRGSTAGGREACSLRLDSAKAKRRLAWTAMVALPIALEWTVNWYRSFGSGADARRLVEEDIERFEAIVG